MSQQLASAILASASRLGINPRDLATAISYETAGTFDPWKAGPTTQYGQHRGLIQWGEPQRQQYGVTEGMPVEGQMQAVERYLTDAGVKPGMGLMDVYSAINAGRVGRNNASDANNGGAPGTVADKVTQQMAGHMANAERLLGGAGGDVPAQAPALPPPIEVASVGAPAGLLAPSAPDAPAASPDPANPDAADPYAAMMKGLLAPTQTAQKPQDPFADQPQPGGLLAQSRPRQFQLGSQPMTRSRRFA